MKVLLFAKILILFLLSQAILRADELTSPLTHTKDDVLFQEIPSVYSASKYEQKVSKAPASVSIVTADEIKKWGYRNFGDIIASLKGFYNTSDRNYGYAGARGFGLPSDYNTRLLLLIDGHRYNDNIFESFYTDEGFPVDIDMIERVEVIRGPSSSLYGTSAFLGVINVITKRGRDQDGANIKYSYGSNDSYKTSASFGKRFNNGVEAFVSGSFYDSQGYKRLYSKEFDQLNNNNGIYNHNDEEQARKLLGKISYSDFTLQGLYVKRSKDIPTAPFDTVFNSPLTKTFDQAAFVELSYNHTFENQLNLQARASYNNYRYTGDYPKFIGSTSGIEVNNDLVRGQWWRAGFELSKVFLEDHRITLGSEFQDDFDQFQTNYDTTAGLTRQGRSSEVQSYRWGIFIQDEYSITSQLTFNAGIRYDYYSVFGDTVNPRLALIYNPWNTTTFKLLYGTAFRSPSQFEINSPLAGVADNNRLKPEKLETVEFILEHYFNEHLRGEFNLFHTQVDGVIAQNNINEEISQNQNIDDVRSNGLELQLEDNWSNGFQARISYSWQDTTYNAKDERLPNSPEHMVKLNLIAPLWEDFVFLGLETRYLSGRKRSQPDPSTNLIVGKEVGDYVVSNLTLFTRNWLPGLEMSAGAYNLFDERYFDPASNNHRQTGILQDGLTFRFEASLDF